MATTRPFPSLVSEMDTDLVSFFDAAPAPRARGEKAVSMRAVAIETRSLFIISSVQDNGDSSDKVRKTNATIPRWLI